MRDQQVNPFEMRKRIHYVSKLTDFSNNNTISDDDLIVSDLKCYVL